MPRFGVMVTVWPSSVMVISAGFPAAGSSSGGCSSSVATLPVVPAMVRLAASIARSTPDTSNGFSCCRMRTHALRWLTCGETVLKRTRVTSFGSGSVWRKRNCVSCGQSTHSLPHQWPAPGRS